MREVFFKRFVTSFLTGKMKNVFLLLKPFRPQNCNNEFPPSPPCCEAEQGVVGLEWTGKLVTNRSGLDEIFLLDKSVRIVVCCIEWRV